MATPSVPLESVYTPAMVAIAVERCERTVHRWAAAGRIPSHRVGGRLVFTADDLDEIVESILPATGRVHPGGRQTHQGAAA